MFKKVLLPLDGSENSRKTWSYAKHLMDEGSKVEFLYVNEDIWMDTQKTECNKGQCRVIDLFDSCDVNLVEVGSEKNDRVKKKEAKICEIRSQVKDFFKEYSDHITMKVVNGNPAHQIMTVSKKENFDVIIMSTHGVGALQKLTLGSVTHKVVNHSEVPVLIVR
tara:strand:+ start:232 stop:723 length:492 start_codon:yes stop_codon:yes gene_type:complete